MWARRPWEINPPGGEYLAMGLTLVLQRTSVGSDARALDLAREARARLAAAPGTRSQLYGRAWINGREVGGAPPRFAHLIRSYD